MVLAVASIVLSYETYAAAEEESECVYCNSKTTGALAIAVTTVSSRWLAQKEFTKNMHNKIYVHLFWP